MGPRPQNEGRGGVPLSQHGEVLHGREDVGVVPTGDVEDWDGGKTVVVAPGVETGLGPVVVEVLVAPLVEQEILVVRRLSERGEATPPRQCREPALEFGGRPGARREQVLGAAQGPDRLLELEGAAEPSTGIERGG